MRPSRIEVHIEELVLHGFAPEDRYAIAAAVERELGRLFIDPTVLPVLQYEDRFPLRNQGQIDLAPDAGAEPTGWQVAQTDYRIVK